MTMNEIQDVLKSLMRGIDKKTELTVESRPNADTPCVTVHLRCANAKRPASLQLKEADLLAARTDLVRRNRVRTVLKRARDRMWEETSYIHSTKVERDQAQGAAFFHSSQRGRGRR